ncbi:unnamed protein product, partial [Ixodes hexagonus]
SLRRGLEAGSGSRVMSGLCCDRVLAASICVLLVGVTVTVTAHEATEPFTGDSISEKKLAAAEIRKTWNAREVVRDLEHIKKDLGKMMLLQETGEMSEQELVFFYFRMHDFDNNNLLDGQELMAAMQHTNEAEHKDGHHQGLDHLIDLTDSALLSDLDHDGFLSYPEMRDSMGRIR